MRLLITFLMVMATYAGNQNDGLGRTFGIIYPGSSSSTAASDQSTRLASLISSKLNKTNSGDTKVPAQNNTSTTSPVELNETTFLNQISTIMSRIGITHGLNLSNFDVDQLQNNTDLIFILTHSLELILAQGIQATLLKDTVYNISAVFNISRQDDNSSEYYVELELQTLDDFIVNITFLTSYQPDTKAWQTLYFNFAFADEVTGSILEVNWNLESGTYIITESSVAGTIKENVPVLSSTVYHLNISEYLYLGGYQLMESDKIGDDPLIKVLMDMGAKYVAKVGINTGILMNSTWDISKIYNVHSQENVLYRYDVEIENGSGSDMRVNYEVYYNGTTKEVEVQSFGFNMIRNG